MQVEEGANVCTPHAHKAEENSRKPSIFSAQAGRGRKLEGKESNTERKRLFVVAMSLLRKIRRRHKAFVQIHGDRAASVFPVDDGENVHEDEDTDFIADSLQQADEQNADIPIRAPPSHETHPMPFSHFSVQTDVSAQSSIFIPADSGIEVGHGVQVVGKESRFWTPIVKTAAFLLVTAVVFSVGKLAAVGITLTVAFSCKLFARDRIDSRASLISAETGQGHRSRESLPDGEAAFMEESNEPVGMLVSHLVMNANGHTLDSHDEEALKFTANRDTLLTQRRKLKRLNCIKIPPSASPFVDPMQDSPSSSAKTSPRTWFRNTGSSTPTGKGTVASSAEIDKQGKFKSKALLRHLRRKGEPQSAPSSPLSSSQEGNKRFCIASDGSDIERSAHPMAPVHRKSKFRPASPAKEAPVIDASPAKEAPVIDASMEWTLQTLAARKGERTFLPATLTASEAMVPDVCTAAIKTQEMETPACMPAGRETLAAGLHLPPFQAVGKMQSALMPATPTSRDATVKVDIHSPVASTHELQHKRRGNDQSSRRPVTQEGIMAKAAASINQDLLLVAVQKGGEKRRKQVRVGTPWVAAGLAITIAGLLLGRMVAVTGLVCYWYALSLKNRKALERRR